MTDLALADLRSSAVEMFIRAQVQSSGVGVTYSTLGNNKPKDYANTIYVWKASGDAVPWDKAPDGTTAVSKNDPVGTEFVDFDFGVKQDYIVGYAMFSDPSAVSSTVYIPGDTYKDPTTYVTTDTTLSLNSWDSGYIQVKLAGLRNHVPAGNAWVGVWDQDRVPYSGDPIAKTDVTLKVASGAIFIPNVPVKIDSTYSVGYFMTKETPNGRRSLACSVTFST